LGRYSSPHSTTPSVNINCGNQMTIRSKSPDDPGGEIWGKTSAMATKLLELSGFSVHKVNGLYRKRLQLVGKRSSWISNSGKVLWYNDSNSWWMVSPSDKVGTDKCYVYCGDEANDPSEVKSPWLYFDSKSAGGPQFKEDVLATVVRADKNSVFAGDESSPPRKERLGMNTFNGRKDNLAGAEPIHSRSSSSTCLHKGSNIPKRYHYENVDDCPAGGTEWKISKDWKADRFSHRRGRSLSRERHRAGRYPWGSDRGMITDNSSDRTSLTSVRYALQSSRSSSSTSVPQRPRAGILLRKSPRPDFRTRPQQGPQQSIRNVRGGTRRACSVSAEVGRGSHTNSSPMILRSNGNRTPSFNTTSSSRHSRSRSARPFKATHAGAGHSSSNEYENLRRKHEGGICVTKYPFKSKMFSSPKKTRINVRAAGCKPALEWGSNGKEMYFADIKNVTIGIKSNTFRRFESQIMKSGNIQPNQCVSVHNYGRTLDLVLKSSKDAQDFKRYLELSLKDPSLLVK